MVNVLPKTLKMSSNELSEQLQNHVDQICKENGFSDYTIDVQNGSNLGDGFSSHLITVKITERSSRKELNLVCKLAPLNANHRKEFLSDVMFDREATFYNKVAPVFTRFQEEKNVPKDDQFLSYPKCFAAIVDHEREEYVIILEDLRPMGFKLWNKMEIASIDSARLAMRELGKFHGISIAMKDQKPDEFVEFMKITDILRDCLKSEKLLGILYASLDRAINSLKQENHKNIIREIKENAMEHITTILNDKNEFAVLSHGDFWSNNCLFRFNENDAAGDIRILDWQIIRYVTPASDILHNIFSSTDKALRDKEYDNLIQMYYQTLSKTVELLGSNPDELFSFDDLQNELKRCGNYALIMAPIVIQTLLAGSSKGNITQI